MTDSIVCSGCGAELTKVEKWINEEPVCDTCFDTEMSKQQEEALDNEVRNVIKDNTDVTDESEEVVLNSEEPLLEELSDELRFTALYVQELLPQILGQDFIYGIKPNPRANHLEVTVQSLFVRSVNLTFAVPARVETLAGLRRAVIQIAVQLYTAEEKTTKKFLVPEKKIVVPR